MLSIWRFDSSRHSFFLSSVSYSIIYQEMARHISFFRSWYPHRRHLSLKRRVCGFLCARTPLLILIETLVPHENSDSSSCMEARYSCNLSTQLCLSVCRMERSERSVSSGYGRENRSYFTRDLIYNLYTFVTFKKPLFVSSPLVNARG